MTFAGNDVEAWLRAAAWIVGAVLLMKIILPLVIRRISKWAALTSTHWDNALVDALRAVRWVLVALVVMHPASSALDLSDTAERWISGVATVAFFLQLALCVNAFIGGWILNVRQQSLEKDPSTTSALSILSFIVRTVAWAILLLLLLDNLGFDVNALVAGLGIGGIAIGLALQNILSDLFASLSIVIDKPFQVGDFVIIDEFLGTVENIGLKTTRLRSLGGEVLVFSNGDLTKSRLRNYKLMAERRVVFKFGLAYGATAQQLEQAANAVKEVIGTVEQARFDRAHFLGFSGASLDFEVVYWMRVPDYNAYCDAQQAINLGMMREFARIGVEFGVSSRTLVHGGQEGLAVALAQAPGTDPQAPGTEPAAPATR